jgi:glycerophosphoryl diester phosphodiesterase
VWTVNDAEGMRAMVRSRASGVITDFPQLMAQVLQEQAE